MAATGQTSDQRAKEKRSHAILLKEAEFRPQFLLRDGVRADYLSNEQKR